MALLAAEISVVTQPRRDLPDKYPIAHLAVTRIHDGKPDVDVMTLPKEMCHELVEEVLPVLLRHENGEFESGCQGHARLAGRSPREPAGLSRLGVAGGVPGESPPVDATGPVACPRGTAAAEADRRGRIAMRTTRRKKQRSTPTSRIHPMKVAPPESRCEKIVLPIAVAVLGPPLNLFDRLTEI